MSQPKHEFDTGAQSCFAILRIYMSELKRQARHGGRQEKRKASIQLEALKELDERYKDFFQLGQKRRTLLSDIIP